MNITIPHEANASELVMRLGGAVHGVGGPPATLDHDGVKHPVGALAEINDIVKSAGESTSDWTVSSDYTAPPVEDTMIPGVTHDINHEPWGVKADESEK